MSSTRLMTTKQVADLLQVPVATLYRWRYYSDGPSSFRVGRHLRYRQAEVEAWIAQQEAKHPTKHLHTEKPHENHNPNRVNGLTQPQWGSAPGGTGKGWSMG